MSTFSVFYLNNLVYLNFRGRIYTQRRRKNFFIKFCHLHTLRRHERFFRTQNLLIYCISRNTAPRFMIFVPIDLTTSVFYPLIIINYSTLNCLVLELFTKLIQLLISCCFFHINIKNIRSGYHITPKLFQKKFYFFNV